MILDCADFVFHVWPDGDVERATIRDRTEANHAAKLDGHSITELVHPDSVPAMMSLIEAARTGKSTQNVRIRHSDLIRNDSHANYTAHLAGDGKNVIVIGTALTINTTLLEQAVGAEISRAERPKGPSSAENYQHLFETVVEGLLMVSAATGMIEEANGIASRLLDQPVDALIGSQLSEHFVQTGDKPEPFGNGMTFRDVTRQPVRTKRTGETIHLTIQSIRGQEQSMLVVRLSEQASAAPQGKHHAAIAVLRKIAVPFLLTNSGGIVTWVNDAFADLTPDHTATGRSVNDVLSIPAGAFALAQQQADTHGRFLTSLSALEGYIPGIEDLHISMISVEPGQASGYGFVFKPLTDGVPNASKGLGSPDDELTDLVGTAPMKTLVRRSTDIIESRCISAALRLTGNNRAAAAQILGLSRQSLYLKMHQHKVQ